MATAPVSMHSIDLDRPPLSVVVAIARNGVIGRAGGLPWDWPEDRAHFLALTLGRALIMGKRTFEETGRPLPNRRNIIVSRTLVATPVRDQSGETMITVLPICLA